MIIYKKNSENNFITLKKGSTTEGFITLSDNVVVRRGMNIDVKERTCVQFGEVAKLNLLMQIEPRPTGRIGVYECTYDTLADAPAYIKELVSANKTEAELCEIYGKKAGSADDAIALYSNGRQILRFAYHDTTGTNPDVRCQHDNTAEAKAYWEAQQSAQANLGTQPSNKAGKANLVG